MLLLAPCQSAIRKGWPASAARTAAVTGATWVGSATSSSTWLAASRQAEELLRRAERDEDLAAVVFRHADLEHRHHAEAALLRRHAEIGAARLRQDQRQPVAEAQTRMRPSQPGADHHRVLAAERVEAAAPDAPGDDGAGAQFLGRDAADQAAAGAAGLAGQQHLALDGRRRPARRPAGGAAVPPGAA